MKCKLFVLALATAAGTASAQPGTFTDLGDRTAAQAFTQSVTSLGGSDIQWFRVQLPAVVAAAGWVDIWTTPTANPTPATDMTDTEIALYDNAGNGASTLWNDDDGGPGLYSQLSYGSTTSRGASTYTGQTNGAARNGNGGPLAGGVYWLAVGRYNVNWTTGFGAGGTSTSTQTTTLLNFDISPNTEPYPPTGTGAASPVSAQLLDSVLFTVTVAPGGNPVSTAITVTGDMSAIGGGSSVAFHDDGLDGDASSGDGVYSYQYMIPNGTVGGPYLIPVTIADAQSRSSTLSIAGSVFNPTDIGQIGAGAGGSEVVTTVDVNIGAGAVTWLKFSIGTDVLNASTDYLDIDTEPSGGPGSDGTPTIGSINDTELGMYGSDGTFLDTDDDDGSDWHSRLTYGDNTNIRPAFGNGTTANGRDGDLTAGTYYLACGCFNSVFNTGFDASSTSAATGTIQVNFRTNIPGGGTGPCSVADVGVAGGLPGHDNLLNNNDFIAFITLFFASDPQADLGMAGGLPGSDGQWNNNDFIAFIGHFFDDAAQCNG